MKVSLLLLIALLAISPSRQATAPGLIEPPFVRKWTQWVGNQAVVIAVRDGVVYYRSTAGLGTLDLVTGERKWQSFPGRWIGPAAIQGQSIYAIARTKEAGDLVAVDIETQQTRT